MKVLLDLKNSNFKAIIDADDRELVFARTWYLTTNGYVASWLIGERAVVLLHRHVVNAVGKNHVDHLNGDKLDNRKSNLRVTTAALNQVNRKRPNKNNTSGIRGVALTTLSKSHPWRAQICTSKRIIHLGLFETKEQACAARREAEIKYFGEQCPSY